MENQQLIQPQLMSNYKYTNTFPKPFLNDLVSNKVLPFVGAGFSKNAEIPNNRTMLDWDRSRPEKKLTILG